MKGTNLTQTIKLLLRRRLHGVIPEVGPKREIEQLIINEHPNFVGVRLNWLEMLNDLITMTEIINMRLRLFSPEKGEIAW